MIVKTAEVDARQGAYCAATPNLFHAVFPRAGVCQHQVAAHIKE
jgi:hypothetical protein